MVCETLINKKLMYRLYAASRLTKICVLLLLILVKLVDCLEKCLICRHIRRFAD